jgi:ubiquinone biosynthesis protein COQ9
MTDPMQEIKDRLLLAALPDVPFDGWSGKTLAAAAVRLGFDASLGERAFPGGGVAAALHFIDLGDRQLLSDAGSHDFAGKGLTARVTWLIRQRILPWAPHREAVSRAVSLLALPLHAAAAARATWRTADLIWYLAGDQAVDFSYYSKRASLTAVYSATLLTWLADQSEGSSVTWDFLDRRAGDLARLPKLLQAAKTRAAVFGQPFAGLVAGARRRGAAARNFGLLQAGELAARMRRRGS